MGYFEHLAVLIFIYIILSVSLNITVGFVGMLNLGHAAFFGIGAYVSALLVLAGYPFIVAFMLAGIVAGLAGFALGIPTLRLRGDYLAIATLGFGEITRAVLKNWNSVTRGPIGLPGIPKPSLFGLTVSSQFAYLIFTAIIALVVIFLVYRILHSPFGKVLKAIREDETAAISLGKDVFKFRLWALGIGSFFAGIAGSLFAHYVTFIDPSVSVLNETILMLSMVVLGGLGSISGSVLGAVLLMLLPEPLRFFSLPSPVLGAMRQMIYALVLILFMLYKPDGLVKEGSKFSLKSLKNFFMKDA